MTLNTPTIEKLARDFDGKVKVAKIDIEAAPELSAQFGIQSIPTVLLFKNGTIAHQFRPGENREKVFAEQMQKLAV